MVRISTVILIVIFVLAAGYSFMVLVVPTIVLEEDFQAITGKSYDGAVINVLNGNTFDSVVFLVGLAVSLVALFLPVRTFFARFS